MKFRLHTIIALIGLVVLASCEQPETPVVLPKAIGKKFSYEMGNDYSNQIYVDLEAGHVKSVKVSSWDLAFACDPTSNNIYLNGGGAGVLIAGLTKSNFALNFQPKQLKWRWDAANGMSDSLALNGWMTNGQSNDSVYVIDRGSTYTDTERYFQFKLLICNNDSFVIQIANRYGQQITNHTIVKNHSKLLTYFTFANGGSTLDFEPQKSDWDLCFLNYRSVYYEFNPPLLYSVVGTFINTKNIQVAMDSSSRFTFEEIGPTHFNLVTYNSNRDAVGFEWKVPMFGGTGVTYRTRNYVTYFIKEKTNGNTDKLFKLRFIDFYDTRGNKGAPTYEIVRVQ